MLGSFGKLKLFLIYIVLEMWKIYREPGEKLEMTKDLAREPKKINEQIHLA